MTAPATSRAFHVMSKPTGAICNLDCEYCFFLSKDQLYPGSDFRMDPTVHEAYLSQLLAAHGDADEVVVAFQGGEPTMMGVDFFRRTIELERRYARPGQQILNTMQTNATLLDDDWGEFLREHSVLVGISIDGPRAMHDAYRVDKGGKPTYDRVIRGLDVLKRHGVEWNALTTVNSANGDHGREVYTFLRDELGASFVQLIPIVERVTAELLPLAESGWGDRGGRPLYRQEGGLVTHRTVGPEQYGRFLVDVFEEWVRHDVGDVFVQMFDTSLAHWMGMDQAGMCVHARTCGSALALEHNGVTASGTSPRAAPCSSWSRRPSRWPSVRRSSTRCPTTAWAATCGSPATAVAPRTGSAPALGASRGCTTCAPDTRRSSGTSPSR